MGFSKLAPFSGLPFPTLPSLHIPLPMLFVLPTNTGKSYPILLLLSRDSMFLSVIFYETTQFLILGDRILHICNCMEHRFL